MTKWFLLAILLVGFLTSFLKLDEVPPGISHDELEYINNGYSIYKTGKDLYGNFLPLTVGGVGYVAIPAYLAGLPTAVFGLNEYSARIMPVIFATIEILLIFGIAKTLFKSETVGLAAAAILALSAWGLKISRVMLDSSTALFFFLLGIYLFLKAKDIKLISLSLIILCLGMLSYYGAIFIFPFVVLALTIYRFDFLKKIKKQFITSGLVIFLIAGAVLALMLFNPAGSSRSLGRSKELIFFNIPKINDNVIYDRAHSTSPELLNELFVNKATYLWRIFFFNYLEAFSPRMIFVEGDPNVNYGLWGRGELAILDFPLVLLGAYYLFKRYKKGVRLVVLLILIGPITSGLTGTVYATRAFLMWPFSIVLAGAGLAWLFEWKRVVFLIFLIFYLFFFFGRLHQYFFRYPVYAKEAWFDSEKQLAFYLMDHPNEKITIYALEGREMFMEYFFFSKLDPKLAQRTLSQEDHIRADITVGSFRFFEGCFDPGQDKIDHKVIVSTRCVPLNLELADEVIKTRDGDNRVKWAIFTP